MLAGTTGASFEQGTFMRPGAPVVTGAFDVSHHLVRADAGVTLRFGVRYVPTVRAAFGVQARHVAAPVVQTIAGPRADVRDGALGVDLVGALAIGVDVRLDRRTVIGVAVGGTYAVPLGGDAYRSVEASAFWARYWYPRW